AAAPQTPVAASAAPIAESSPIPEVTSAEVAVMESSVDEFKEELERYRSQLAGLDLRMRECAQAPDSATLQECLDDLKIANTQYVEQQQQAAERVQNQPQGPLAELGTRLSEAVDAQSSEIADVNARLKGLRLEGDLAAGCQALLDHSARLAD